MNNNLRALQLEMERNYAHFARDPFCEDKLLAVPGIAEEIKAVAKDTGYEERIIKMVFTKAMLHGTLSYQHRVDVSVMVGHLMAPFGYDVKKACKCLEDILNHPQEILVWNEQGQMITNVSLSREESQQMDQWEMKFPSLVPLTEVTPEQDGYLFAWETPNSKHNPPNYGLPLYDIIRANKVAYTLDWDLVEHGGFNFSINAKNFAKGKKNKDPNATVANFRRELNRMWFFADRLKTYGCDRFYFAHKPDGRCRIYCIGFALNEQGQDKDKAILMFADGEQFTPEGIAQLKSSLVCSIGPRIDGHKADKTTFEARFKWFNEHEHELEKFVYAMKDDERYAKNGFAQFTEQYACEEPMKAQSLLKVWRDLQKNPTMKSGVISMQDAVCSGLGIQALVLHDERMLKELGYIYAKEPSDMYSSACELLGLDPAKDRTLLKVIMVPLMYSGMLTGIEQLGAEEFFKMKKVLEDNFFTWKTLFRVSKLWKKDWDVLYWFLPDGARTQVLVKKECETRGKVFDQSFTIKYTLYGVPNKDANKSLWPNIIHSFDAFLAREMQTLCSYDPEKKRIIEEYLATGKRKGSLASGLLCNNPKLKELLEIAEDCGYYSAHIMDLVDESNIHNVPRKFLENLVKVLPEKPFPITRIHDCFGAHPNHGPKVRELYRYCMYNLYNSNVLPFVCAQLGIKIPTLPKSPRVARALLDGQYALI